MDSTQNLLIKSVLLLLFVNMAADVWALSATLSCVVLILQIFMFFN